jgi:carbohydrate-binding module 48 (isoamylase N-terminal domain)
MSLVGDFNNWNQDEHKCKRLDNGVFEVFVPDDAELDYMGWYYLDILFIIFPK